MASVSIPPPEPKELSSALKRNIQALEERRAREERDASLEARIADRERFPILRDADGAFRAAYDTERTCTYLIRPDGYVGYRADRLDGAALQAYLLRIFR